MSLAVETTDILLLGASFAGVEVVYQMVRMCDGKPPSMVVVDRQRAHGYLPLVQERLCGGLAVESSRLDTQAFVESVPNARYVQAEVQAFEPSTKTVTLATGQQLRGRFVVVALGSTFEAPPAIEGGAAIRSYKREAEFESTRAALRQALASPGREPEVVVVGGGISGCELAGELGGLARKRPSGWNAPRVRLVSASPRLAGPLRGAVARRAERALRAQGVQIELNARVSAIRPPQVEMVRDGSTFTAPADLVLWAGGVRPAAILERLGLPLNERGWLRVGPTLQCFADVRAEQPDVFACGDAVRVLGGDGEWPTMQRAIECLWQAKVVARNVLRLAAEPAGYPHGVPPLDPHRLREEFFYGLSLGRRSLVVYRGLAVDLPGLNHGFRRWLMRQYLARYAPLPG